MLYRVHLLRLHEANPGYVHRRARIRAANMPSRDLPSQAPRVNNHDSAPPIVNRSQSGRFIRAKRERWRRVSSRRPYTED
jgi:hypothetical protein